MAHRYDSGFDDLIAKLQGERKQWKHVLKERLSEHRFSDTDDDDERDEEKGLEQAGSERVHQIGGGNSRLYSLLPVQHYRHKLWRTNNFCDKCMQLVVAGYDCVQCMSCNMVLHRDCCDEQFRSAEGRFMCSDCQLGATEHRSHTQKKRGEESLKMRVLAGILRVQAVYRMRSQRRSYARIRNGVLRVQACFRRKKMTEAVLKSLLSNRLPIKIRIHNIQLVRSEDADVHDDPWLPARPEEMPLGTPLCDVAARLEVVRDQLYLGGPVFKHPSSGWFNEAVSHPPPEEFPELSYALTVAVFEPYDTSDLRQQDLHQVFRMDIPLAVAHSRICFDGSEVLTLAPKKHTVLLPSALAALHVVCTLVEVQAYPRGRCIGQVAFDLSNYVPWHQCIFVQQECGPPKHDILPDEESRLTHRSGSEHPLRTPPLKQEGKLSTARTNTISIAVFPASATTCKAGPAVELSSQRVAVAVRRRIWLVVIEQVLAVYSKLGDDKPKLLFNLRGAAPAYDASQCIVTLQQPTGKQIHILLTNDPSDWLPKLGIHRSANEPEAGGEASKQPRVSFAALGELPAQRATNNVT